MGGKKTENEKGPGTHSHIPWVLVGVPWFFFFFAVFAFGLTWLVSTIPAGSWLGSGSGIPYPGLSTPSTKRELSARDFLHLIQQIYSGSGSGSVQHVAGPLPASPRAELIAQLAGFVEHLCNCVASH